MFTLPAKKTVPPPQPQGQLSAIGVLGKVQHLISLLELPVVLGVGIMLIYLLGETVTMDWRLSFAYINGQSIYSDKVAIVEIDEETIYYDFIQQRKSYSPLDRSLLDSLITAIEEYQPAAVGLDILFEAPSDNADIDEKLSETLAGYPNIVISSSLYVSKRGQTLEFVPLPLFTENNTLIGFANIMGTAPLKGSTKMRRYRLMEEASGEVVPSLAYALFLNYENNKKNPGKWIEQEILRSDLANKKSITCSQNSFHTPAQINQEYFVNFSRNSPVLVSAHAVYNRQINPEILKGKIVIIGGSSERLQDNFDTPVGRLPGVMIHGYIISNLIESLILKYPSLWIQTIFAGVFIIISLLLINWKGFYRGLFYLWMFLTFYWTVVFVLFLKFPTVWIPLNAPSMIVIFFTFNYFIWSSLDESGKASIRKYLLITGKTRRKEFQQKLNGSPDCEDEKSLKTGV